MQQISIVNDKMTHEISVAPAILYCSQLRNGSLTADYHRDEWIASNVIITLTES